MGNYNCQECIDNDIKTGNEMVINTKLYQSEPEIENNRNSREKRLKKLKLSHDDNKINNNNNQVTHKLLRKEEIDNKILLKKELNKIKDIEISKKETNASDEMTKLIELQRKQILAQEKIIEELRKKQTLFEEQQSELEQAKRKIRIQQTQLELHEKNNNKINSHREFGNKHLTNDNLNIIKSTKIENNKGKLKPSKSSPNHLKTLKKFKNVQIVKPNFINKEEKTEIEGEENQIEDNDNYEKIEEYDEEDDEENNALRYKSQKFKIETYEPIEPGNKNENNDINKYKFEEEEIFENNNNNIIEPRDSQTKNFRKAVIPKPHYNKNKKDKFEKIKNKEIGPRDSGRNNININFRGTFDDENKNIIEKESIDLSKNISPRDSSKKGDYQYNYEVNEINTEEKNISKDNEQINENLNPTQEIKYIQEEENIENEYNNIINNQIYIPQEKLENKNINEEYIQQEQYNNNNLNDDITQNNNIFSNNGYLSPEYNFDYQQESPKFNSIIESQNKEIYNEDFNTSLKNEEYQNEEIKNINDAQIGSYLNDINEIKVDEPFLFEKENQNQVQNLTEIVNIDLNNNMTDFTQEEKNTLMYSDDRINKNFFDNNINNF